MNFGVVWIVDENEDQKMGTKGMKKGMIWNLMG